MHCQTSGKKLGMLTRQSLAAAHTGGHAEVPAARDAKHVCRSQRPSLDIILHTEASLSSIEVEVVEACVRFLLILAMHGEAGAAATTVATVTMAMAVKTVTAATVTAVVTAAEAVAQILAVTVTATMAGAKVMMIW